MDCIPPGSLSAWDFPGKNTGVGCHFLLKGIFLTRGLNLCQLHWQVDSPPLTTREVLRCWPQHVEIPRGWCIEQDWQEIPRLAPQWERARPAFSQLARRGWQAASLPRAGLGVLPTGWVQDTDGRH